MEINYYHENPLKVMQLIMVHCTYCIYVNQKFVHFGPKKAISNVCGFYLYVTLLYMKVWLSLS